MINAKLKRLIDSSLYCANSAQAFKKYNYFRCWLIERLKDYTLPTEILQGNQAGNNVVLYGSAIAGTSLNDGDADFSMVFFSNAKSGDRQLIDIDRSKQESLLSAVFSHIREKEKAFIKSQRIFRARVPVVQFCSTSPEYPNFKYDLSLSLNGIRNSLLLRRIMISDRQLLAGCLVAKLWGKQVNILNSRRGLISPYALTILYIYYMQTIHGRKYELDTLEVLDKIILRSTSEKYSNVEEFNSPLSIEESDFQEVESDIAGFFRFYSKDFDFDASVVDIRTVSPFLMKDAWIKDIESLSSLDRWNLLGHENIFIRDPFEPHNLGRSVDFLRSEEIREAFRLASRKKDSLYFMKM